MATGAYLTGSGDEAMAGARPEISLLLCCARTQIDSRGLERIRVLLEGDIDWTYTVRTSLAHGVTPLLYRSLSKTCREAVPKGVMDQLHDYFRTHAQHNLFLTCELLKLLSLFEAHGISALPYKGPVLASSVYGDVSLRTFTDLDILVNKQDILRAKDLLISRGFELSAQLTDGQERAHLRSPRQKDFGLVSSDGLVKVELHWGIASELFLRFGEERVWERLERVSLGGKAVLNLPPGDLLLILCVHGAKHFFNRLMWVCDIAELIRTHQDLDWDQVIAQAGRLSIKRMLFVGLYLVRDLLGASLPERVLKDSYADPGIKLLASQMRERLFSENYYWSEVFERGGHQIILRDRLRDRMRVRRNFYLYYLGLIFTPNVHDKELMSLPGPLSFLYYLLRPIRLAKLYGPALLARIRKRLKRSKL